LPIGRGGTKFCTVTSSRPADTRRSAGVEHGARELPYGIKDGRVADQLRGHGVDADSVRKDANVLIGTGLAIGAFGAISAAVVGATCPLCVVAAPALLGWGLLKRIRARRE
jgi:hypothetical protein